MPVVLINGEEVSTNEVLQVASFRKVETHDFAEITLKKTSESVPSLKQTVELNLSAKGDELFSGEVIGVVPAAGGGMLIRCKSKALAVNYAVGLDPTFVDTLTTFTAQNGMAHASIDNSRERQRLLYDLYWTLNIESGPEGPKTPFDGRIVEVNRRYRQGRGSQIDLWLVNGDIRDWLHRKVKSAAFDAIQKAAPLKFR